MAVSPCAVEDFSHAPETSYGGTGGNEVSLVAATLGGSVSFGRFMSESLDWGRWSSFRHNRYLEEVEKHSVPGSVAQKRAYFEARYRKKAASQAVDQANLITHSGHERETNDSVIQDANCVDPINVNSNEEEELSIEEATNEEEEEVEIQSARVSPEPSANCSTQDELGCRLDGEMENFPIIEDKDIGDSSSLIELFESPIVVEVAENQCRVDNMEVDRPGPSDKLPLKEIFITNQKSADSTEKKSRIPISQSPTVHRSSRPSPSPMSAMQCVKENKSPQTDRNRVSGSNNVKRSTSNSLHMSINLAQSQNRVRSPVLAKTSSVLEKIRAFNNFSRGSQGSQQPSRTQTSKVYEPRHCLLKTPTLNSSQFQPHSLKTPVSQASQDRHNPFRIPTSNAFPDCPLRTTKTASLSEPRNSASATTQSESGRTKTLSHQTPSNTREMDGHLPLSTVPNSPRIKGSRARSQFVSSSISFRTDERVEKRKELCCNYEDNLDSKDAKKLQFQGKAKVKSEIKKLQQSLCFKAKPMPDFYRTVELRKNEVRKVPLTQPRSPKLGRRVNPTAAGADSNPSPPNRYSLKFDGSKHFTEKSSRAPRHHVSSMIRQ